MLVFNTSPIEELKKEAKRLLLGVDRWISQVDPLLYSIWSSVEVVLIFDPSEFPAAVTKDPVLVYNMAYKCMYEPQHLWFTILHELLHLAYCHLQKWDILSNRRAANLAADAIVNWAIHTSKVDYYNPSQRYSFYTTIPTPTPAPIAAVIPYDDHVIIRLQTAQVRVPMTAETTIYDVYRSIVDKVPPQPSKAGSTGKNCPAGPRGSSGSQGNRSQNRPGSSNPRRSQQPTNIDRHGGSIKDYKGKVYDRLGRPIDPQQLAREIKKRVGNDVRAFIERLARSVERFAGKLPAATQRLVEELKAKPAYNYVNLVRNMLHRLLVPKRTYARINRRVHNVRVPANRDYDTSVTAAVFLDTSGSISQKELSYFIGQLYHMARQFKRLKLWAICIDAEPYDPVLVCDQNRRAFDRLKIKGGGGTVFTEAAKPLRKRNIRPDVVFFFTDGYADYPERKDFPYHTVWLIVSNSAEVPEHLRPPFGRVYPVSPVVNS